MAHHACSHMAYYQGGAPAVSEKLVHVHISAHCNRAVMHILIKSTKNFIIYQCSSNKCHCSCEVNELAVTPRIPSLL